MTRSQSLLWTALVALAMAPACSTPSPPVAAPAPAAFRPRATDAADVEARLDALIPRLMAAGDVPGLSIGLVRGGELVWQRSFGVANARTRRPVTRATTFEAASLSKPVFAYAVMKLVDAGKLDLDSPLTDYLPGTYEVGPDPRLARITARHALSHTTGLPNWRNGALTIQLTPGTQFSYSGEGIVYLAKVVEHITGEPFETFMRRTVLEPLGMANSGFDPPRDGADAASPHDAWGDPVERTGPPNRDRNPAAGLRTTAEDYARFVIAVLRGTGLSPAARTQMLTSQIPVIDGGPSSIGRPDPRPLADLTWGLGWGLQATPLGTAFWHWGDNDEAKAYVVALAQPRTAAVVFANSVNGLSIMPEIVAAAVGIPEPGLDWLAYDTYDSPRSVLARAIRAHGAEAALRDYRAGSSPRIPEPQLNTLGSQLAAAHRLPDAIAVLAQNVADHPQSWNAHDRLGEIYALAGDRPRAIASYERSVALAPDNTHGIAALAKLRGAPPAP